VKPLNIDSNEIKVRKLKLEDMPKFLKWGHHSDIRFRHYDFPDCNTQDLKRWYKSKRVLMRKKIFISEDLDGNILGYITIKHINWFKRKAEMGIVFDPNVVGKGYGSASILKMYDIYFNKMKMKTLFLKVADFNKRAQKCYEKAGFRKLKEVVEAFEEQNINFELLLKTNDFYMDEDVLMTQFNYMEIRKKDYELLIEKRMNAMKQSMV